MTRVPAAVCSACCAGGRPAKRVQSEAELREAQWSQEEHRGCCAAACPPTVLIPALILFSDLIGSLASGAATSLIPCAAAPPH